MQATDQLTTRHIPLTGYENFHQDLQTYRVSRDPMTLQLTGAGNVSNSAILDLPNVNTNLPPPLLPNPSSHYHQQQHNQVHPTEVNSGQVTNSEILKSIQSITEVMQQQLLLNSKTTEHGIVQTASLFQEMIMAQEKRDLDPALLAKPTFLGEAKDRPQCLDWVSRVKNVCDQSGHSFHQELINKSGILVQNFIRSLSENITNKELTEKILQFFSDVPTTSQPSETRTTNSSEYSNSSQNSRVPNNYSKEQESNKSSQQASVIRGSFTQIMLNPMQLKDHEFTAWLDRLVEARKNRQERRQRPYRNFRKPYNDGKQNGDTGSRPPLHNRIKPAQELEIQQIMDNFNCEYDDVVEAVDLYNLDVEECTTV